MISLIKSFTITLLIVMTLSVTINDDYFTFNTSSNRNVISLSIATNTTQEFQVYSPVLIDNNGSIVKFIPNENKKKFIIQPQFVKQQGLLYNDYHQGEYWYGIKKQTNPEVRDTSAVFALNRITTNNETYNFIMPLFSLPLTFLNFNSLYRCDNVLIAYQKTNNMVDITIFSEQQSWHLFPEASWGFRNSDSNINFSRQTYPLGIDIQIDVGKNKYCVLTNDVPQNNYNFVEKDIYTVNDLLNRFSTSLQFKDKLQNEEL